MSNPSPAPEGAPSDPSMADILASIRRILTEDDQSAAPAGHGAGAAAPSHAAAGTTVEPAAEDDVLILDRSMMIGEPGAHGHEAAAALEGSSAGAHASPDADADRTVRLDLSEAAAHAAGTDDASGDASPPQAGSEHVSSNSVLMMPTDAAPQLGDNPKLRRPPGPSLTEPGTVTAVASSLGNLARSVAAERTAAIQRNGLSIEDVVREEVRPLLKAWLDMHLPGLVERLVQAEIERVVNRATF